MSKELDILLNKYGQKMVTVLKRETRIDKAVASGDTVNSIKYYVKGNSLVIEYDAVLGVLDEGLRPRQSSPSSYEILQWMKSKNIRARNTRKGTNQFTKSSERNLKASAYAISRAIAEKGTIKRFGHRGTDVLSHVTVGSKLETQFTNEMSDMFEDQIDLVIMQNNGLPNRDINRF